MSRFNDYGGAPAISIIDKTTEPMLWIEPQALEKMQAYCELCDTEVGWLGIIEHPEENIYMCTDVHLLHQDVNCATTEITPTGLIKFAEEVGEDLTSKAYLWGHSHVNMTVSPSGQDDAQVELFRQNGFPRVFRVICNKKGDMEVTLFDFEKNLKVEKCYWVCNYPATVDYDAIKKDIALKVKEKQTYYNKYICGNPAQFRTNPLTDKLEKYTPSKGYSAYDDIKKSPVIVNEYMEYYDRTDPDRLVVPAILQAVEELPMGDLLEIADAYGYGKLNYVHLTETIRKDKVIKPFVGIEFPEDLQSFELPNDWKRDVDEALDSVLSCVDYDMTLLYQAMTTINDGDSFQIMHDVALGESDVVELLQIPELSGMAYIVVELDESDISTCIRTALSVIGKGSSKYYEEECNNGL